MSLRLRKCGRACSLYKTRFLPILRHPEWITFLNRPIGLFANLQRKRRKIKQIGRFQSVYLVQSVHAP